jgi:hypothetical protein
MHANPASHMQVQTHPIHTQTPPIPNHIPTPGHPSAKRKRTNNARQISSVLCNAGRSRTKIESSSNNKKETRPCATDMQYQGTRVELGKARVSANPMQMQRMIHNPLIPNVPSKASPSRKMKREKKVSSRFRLN